MFGLEELSRLGVPTLLALAVLGLIHILNKRYRESEKGDRRAPPRVVGCPNKLEMGTLKGMLANLESSTKMLVEILHCVEETKVELRSIADVTRLYQTGSRSEKVREESRDLLRELLMEIKHRGR